VGTEKRERQKANRALKQQQVAQAQTRRNLLRKVAIGAAAVAAVVLFVWIASNFVSDDDAAPAAGSPAVVAVDSVDDLTIG
jgi:ferric-dicitrate binding protein FerR (iron transport regulator)